MLAAGSPVGVAAERTILCTSNIDMLSRWLRRRTIFSLSLRISCVRRGRAWTAVENRCCGVAADTPSYLVGGLVLGGRGVHGGALRLSS